MLEISDKTNLLEQKSYKYSLQDISDPNLYRDIYPYDAVPRIPFNHRRVPMGMPEEIAEQGGVWIHGPETEKTFAAGEETEYHLSLGSSDLLVRRSAAGTELVFDKENQWKTANGLNILVYDEFTKSLVTAVGFDAFSGYQCIY